MKSTPVEEPVYPDDDSDDLEESDHTQSPPDDDEGSHGEYVPIQTNL